MLVLALFVLWCAIGVLIDASNNGSRQGERRFVTQGPQTMIARQRNTEPPPGVQKHRRG